MIRRPLPFVVLALCCLAAVHLGAQMPRVQPLLGVGNTPAPPPGGVPATEDAFFDDAQVLDLALDINSRDWQALKDNFQSNTYYPADFKWNGQTVRNIGIRSRGTASRSAARPGLRIDFDRYTTGQRFLGLRSVVLRNNITDPSNMHERISFKLFRRLGIPTPRVAAVRLILNGTYDGLYSVVESPDKHYLARILGQDNGVLFKFDRNVGDEPNYFEYKGPDPALYVPHPFQPETNDNDPHPQPIADLIRAIAEEPEPNVRASLGRFIDVDAWVRHAAIENYLAETDGFLGESGMNNYYLYQLANSTMHVILPWDKSETFKAGPRHPVTRNIDDVPAQYKNRLMERFWKFDDLRHLYFDTLVRAADSASELAPGDGRTWLEREVEAIYGQIKGYVQADPTRPYSYADFEAAVEAMRVFARERPGFVRAEADDRRPD